MLRFNQIKIKVGDTVPVVVDGRIQDLEVVDLPDRYTRRSRLFRRLTPHPQSLTVKLPDGSHLACRFFPISH